MPLQNRVNPYGEICYSDQRGTLMGNRGNLHNAQQQIVRKYQLKRWIICLLEFKGRHQKVMHPGYYTELFFLDEATGLAAGHRPCGECQYKRFKEFITLWKNANDAPGLNLAQVDAQLHLERTAKDKPLASLDDLPDGVFMEYETKPYLLYRGSIWEWSFAGYLQPQLRPHNLEVKILTPVSIVKTIAAGFTPAIHPTAI